LTKFDFPSGPDPDRFTKRIDELKKRLQFASPDVLAQFTGATYLPVTEWSGFFEFNLWNQPIRLSFPEFCVSNQQKERSVPIMDIALILYYFSTSDGTAIKNKWISFSDLPNGRFYDQAFQGYSGMLLAQSFREDITRFSKSAEKIGGLVENHGDASYKFMALPRVPILVTYWLGDEDFSASARILFDASASHYLPTDAYAILGSGLTRQLLKTIKI